MSLLRLKKKKKLKVVCKNLPIHKIDFYMSINDEKKKRKKKGF